MQKVNFLEHAVFEKCVTDGRTDGPTDRPTDQQTKLLIELLFATNKAGYTTISVANVGQGH